MHCIFEQGIWNVLLNLVLESIEKQGVNAYAELLCYLSHWHWPHRLHMSKLHELFTPSKRKSNRDAGQFKCQASMGLSLCPVLAEESMHVIILHGCYVTVKSPVCGQVHVESQRLPGCMGGTPNRVYGYWLSSPSCPIWQQAEQPPKVVAFVSAM